jgi:hypothetical protein
MRIKKANKQPAAGNEGSPNARRKLVLDQSTPNHTPNKNATLHSHGHKSLHVAANNYQQLPLPVVIEDTGAGQATLHGLGRVTFEKTIASNIGKVNKAKQIGKGKWVISCTSHQQQQLLAEATSLSGITIKAHIPSVTTEGVIKRIPLDEDLDSLSNMEGSHIKKVTRLTTKEGNPSRACRVTFLLPKLPATIRVGLEDLPIEPYTPPVIRCTHCQKLGHTKNSCTRKHKICPKCAEHNPKHNPNNCTNPRKCANCGGGHTSAYAGCPTYQVRLRAGRLRCQQHMPFGQALEMAKRHAPNQARSTDAPPQPGPPLLPTPGPSMAAPPAQQGPVKTSLPHTTPHPDLHTEHLGQANTNSRSTQNQDRYDFVASHESNDGLSRKIEKVVTEHITRMEKRIISLIQEKIETIVETILESSLKGLEDRILNQATQIATSIMAMHKPLTPSRQNRRRNSLANVSVTDGSG